MATRPLPDVAPLPRRRMRSVSKRLREHLLAGLIVVIPVSLTIYLAVAIIRGIDDKIRPLVPDAYDPATYLGRDLPGFGLVIFLLVTVVAGFIARGYAGRRLVQLGERLVDRLPVIRSIYGAIKQIAEAVFTQSDKSFSRPCLIEYPTRGKWALAFVVGPANGELPAKTREAELIVVFMPTAPNPITGFLFFVPRRDVVILDMTIEDGAKMIISAGLVAPTGQKGPRAPEFDIPDRPAA